VSEAKLPVSRDRVRLEHLFDIEMKYVGEPVWLELYGGKDLEGFGEIEGTVTGPKLSGAL